MTDTLTLTLDRTQAYATMRALEHRIIENISTYSIDDMDKVAFWYTVTETQKTTWDLLGTVSDFLEDNSSIREVNDAIDRYYNEKSKEAELPF